MNLITAQFCANFKRELLLIIITILSLLIYACNGNEEMAEEPIQDMTEPTQTNDTGVIELVGAAGVNNIVVVGNIAYAAAGDEGVLVIDLNTVKRKRKIPLPRGTASINDVAHADRLLFVMAGNRPGALSVFSIQDAINPTLVSGLVAVDIVTFSGVSTADGTVVVSGGTSRLSVLTYA